jgi:hypothetical protein
VWLVGDCVQVGNYGIDLRGRQRNSAGRSSRYNLAGSIAGGSFSTPFHPTGRPLTASFTERNNTIYINWR